MCKLKTAVYLCFGLGLSAFGHAADDSDPKRVGRYQEHAGPVLKQYCSKCHGPDKQKAGLQIGRLDPDLLSGDAGEFWEEVLNQLNVGAMPPDGRSPMPLLRKPTQEWHGMAITQILRPLDDRLKAQIMGCSIRTDRWRFTEWADGKSGVELYNHHSDPMEFRNLAVNPDAGAKNVIERLRPELRKRASGREPTAPVNPKRL